MNPDHPSIAIGVTGPNASGKGEVCRFLAELGFVVHSLSDVIRDEARARELPPEREHLIRLGNEMRDRGGPGALAEAILDRLGDRVVIDSIRNPTEVEVLRRLPCFVLIGVRASVDTRFRRSIRRARPGDPESLEAFEQRELQENSANPAAQQLGATFALADRTIDNDGDLEALRLQVLRLLDQIGSGTEV